GAERDFWKLRVGGRERLIGLARRAGQPRGERHQPLALLVEHVLLLAIDLFDRETVAVEIDARRQPASNRGERNRQELGAEPGCAFLPSSQQSLHLLLARVDLVVALILVVAQGRVE